MLDLFTTFKNKIMSSVQDRPSEGEDVNKVNNLVALGVLLWEVAEADDQFLAEESAKIEEVLREHDQISPADMPIVLRAIREASIEKIELFTFTKEVAQHLSRDARINLVEQLFRVACADKQLDERETETIRTISTLFGLDHEEFIAAKVKVKKEFGMDTAGL